MSLKVSLHWANTIPARIEIGQSLLAKCAATYANDQNFSIRFWVEGKRLMTKSDAFPRLALLPRSENEFFPIPFEIYFKFFEVEREMRVQLLTDHRVVDLEGVKR